MKNKAKTINLISILLIVVFIVFSIFTTGGGAYVVRAATSTSQAYEQTNVLDDLEGATIDGESIDLKTYNFDENKSVQLLSFVEFCYSFYSNKQSDFGLYVYVYNPQGLDFTSNQTLNKIEFRAGGNSSAAYNKYSLEYLNRSEKAGYEGLFYKFKVVLSSADRAAILAAVNSSERIYEVSGIELYSSGTNAIEYAVANTYTYTGYAEGYGSASATSDTLNCTVDGLQDVVELNVKHTYYRTETSSLGAGYQVQLDTVYFSVPEEFFTKYGELQRIKAEWYEYKTKPIVVVTANSDYGESFYNYAQQYLGKEMSIGRSLLGSGAYGVGINTTMNGSGDTYSDVWGWNMTDTGVNDSSAPASTLYYLFLTNSTISEYDPYSTIESNGGVSSNELSEYIYSYNKSYKTGTVKGGAISADLFEADIDESRKVDNAYGKVQKGYSYYDFDISTDMQDLNTFSSDNYDFWSNAKIYGFWQELFSKHNVSTEVSKSLPPIQVLTDDDVKGTSYSARKNISDTLCVNYNDVSSLQQYYSNAKANNERVVLFRFATSNYFSAETDIIHYDKGLLLNNTVRETGVSYMAQESVYLDFDIIQLTFVQDGVQTVIPVIMSPTDIISAITPPVNFTVAVSDWWKYALAIAAVLVVVYVIYRGVIYDRGD